MLRETPLNFSPRVPLLQNVTPTVSVSTLNIAPLDLDMLRPGVVNQPPQPLVTTSTIGQPLVTSSTYRFSTSKQPPLIYAPQKRLSNGGVAVSNRNNRTAVRSSNSNRGDGYYVESRDGEARDPDVHPLNRRFQVLVFFNNDIKVFFSANGEDVVPCYRIISASSTIFGHISTLGNIRMTRNPVLLMVSLCY